MRATWLPIAWIGQWHARHPCAAVHEVACFTVACLALTVCAPRQGARVFCQLEVHRRRVRPHLHARDCLNHVPRSQRQALHLHGTHRFHTAAHSCSQALRSDDNKRFLSGVSFDGRWEAQANASGPAHFRAFLRECTHESIAAAMSKERCGALPLRHGRARVFYQVTRAATPLQRQVHVLRAVPGVAV